VMEGVEDVCWKRSMAKMAGHPAYLGLYGAVWRLDGANRG
jgi:hypothetical protein